MAPTRRQACAVVLVWSWIALQCGVYGLYKEQDGKYNWIHSHIGQYTQSVPCGSRMAVFNHDQGVVASILPSDGSMVWRRAFEDGEKVESISCTRSAVVVVIQPVDSSVRSVRAFSEPGQQLWEQRYSDVGEYGLSATIMNSDSGSYIVIIGGPGVLESRSLLGGTLQWEQHQVSVGAAVVRAHNGQRGSVLDPTDAVNVGIVFGGMSSSKQVALKIDTGEVVKDGDVYRDWPGTLKGNDVVLVAAGMYGVSADGMQVCYVPSARGSHTCVKVGIGQIRSLRGGCGDMVIAQTHTETVFIDLAVDVVHSLKSKDAVVSNCENNLIAVGSVGGLVVVDTQDLASAPLAIQVDSPLLHDGTTRIPPSSIALHKGGKKVTLQFEDGTTISGAIEPSGLNVVWQRHDGLADITDSMFSELPVSNAENEEQWQASQPPLSKRLFVQLTILKTQLGMGNEADLLLIDQHQSATSDLLRPTRDADGFRKQIIVATKSGKVAAMHTGDGRVLWDVNFPGKDLDIKVKPWFQSEKENLICALVVHHAQNTLDVYVIDAFTGKVLEQHASVKFSAGSNVVPLDLLQRSGGEQSVFAIIDENDTVTELLPVKDSTVESHFEAQVKYLVKWDISKNRRNVYGVKLSRSGDATLMWNLNIVPQGSSMKIIDVSTRDPDEAIYSAAKAVYGGGVLIKNVNPNMLLITASEQANDRKTSRLVVTAVDSISGRIVYSQEHPRSSGPVKSILSEHWAAYNYWHEEQGRWYIGVVDTYFPQPADLDAKKLLFSSQYGNKTISSYDSMADMIVQSERFRVKFAASCLAVTKTAHGTAAKMLLLGTTNGQIASIDRRMLDPRRPKVLPGTKPTPEQIYERLPPYQPELAVGGPSFVTLYHRIERLRKIQTSAAILESSSLVFAYGLDTYFIRLQPSRGFDMVPDDFPHALLVFMVVGLSAALYVLRKIIQRRTLKMTWQ